MSGLLLAQGMPDAGKPFAHARHAPLKLSCTYCHTTAAKEDLAGFPALSQCRTCHPQMADRKLPSARIYKVPDYVFFSHAVHVAKLECTSCHGEVYRQEQLKVERPTTMPACVACHREHKAATGCNVCHELGQ